MKKLTNIIDFDKPFIIVDFEANGDKDNPHLLQIGAIKVINKQIVKGFNKWCYYDGEITPFIAHLLNKDLDFYKQQAPEAEVWQEFLQFCEGVDQIINYGAFYDNLIIEKLCERTQLKPIKLIDIQENYFNKICGVKELNKASISLDIVNSVFYKNGDFYHLQHNAYDDCILLLQSINQCYKYEMRNEEAKLKQLFDQIYLFPRPKNFRSITKKANSLWQIDLKPNAKIVFIHYRQKNIDDEHVNYLNDIYIIDNNYKKVASFSHCAKKDDNKEFYACFNQPTEYICNKLGLDNYIFISNFDYYIKRIQTSYAAKTKVFPLIYWIPFTWIQIKNRWINGKLVGYKLHGLLKVCKKIYRNYWKYIMENKKEIKK